MEKYRTVRYKIEYYGRHGMLDFTYGNSFETQKPEASKRKHKIR